MVIKLNRIFPTLPYLSKQIPIFFQALKAQSAASRRKPIQARNSDPMLHSIWTKLITQYFPNRADLIDYRIAWSLKRQKRTLASCCVSKSQVIVAKELQRLDCREYLEPLLYHELCHAVLGNKVGFERGKRAWHGRDFRALEAKHPEILKLDQWIKSGGWAHVVRSERAKSASKKRGNNPIKS